MQIRASAFEGESVSVTDLLADSLALTGSATLDGLTAQGNVGCDQLLRNDVNCTDVCSLLRGAHSHRHSHAVVHGGRVRQLAEHQRRGQRGPAELRHRNHGQHTHHQQHGQRRELHHGGRRVHGHADGLGRSNRGKLRSHRGAHRRHADHHRGGLHGPAGLREPGLHLHGHERRSVDGQRGLRRRASSGTVSAPQLFASTSARVFLERDGGAHQCELIMINDEALVQTKSLSTQLSLTTNQRNPGCLVIAGNTGNVVCNTSFTDLSDSRVKTEIAKADVAELLQLFDSVEAKQYKRPDMNGDLRLGFASDDFAGTNLKNLTGTTRWSDGTEMVTLDYSHLTSVLWGVCKGFQARLDALEAWQAQRGPKNK